MTRYGLIGEKLGHSFSKIIHEQLADYTYDLIPLDKDAFHDFMKKKEFSALNVNIPYKRDVLPYLTHIDEATEKIGAVNTIVNRNGVLHGYNTDYFGFLYTIKKHHLTITGKKVLVLGNGGAAQAIFAALRSLQPNEMITVKYKPELNTCTYEEAAKLHADADFIVNTSPVGMYPNVDASPIDLTPYHNLSAVIDLIYNPLTTKFMQQAIEKDILAINGLEMLIAQAKYAVELFLDVNISDEKIEEIHRNLLLELRKK